MLPCPRCGDALAPQERGAHRAWTCGAGHGVLVPLAPLRHALPAATWTQIEEAARSPRASKLACPQCREPFRESAFHPPAGRRVVVDACAACGVLWFDEGELEAARGSRGEAPGQDDAWKGPWHYLGDAIMPVLEVAGAFLS